MKAEIITAENKRADIFNPFTPKSDQCQISSAASPVILQYIEQYEEFGFS